MRDDLTIVEPYDFTVDHLSLGIEGWYATSGTDLVLRSFRSESQPTQKVGGSYVYSTPYEAYRARVSTPSYDYGYHYDGHGFRVRGKSHLSEPGPLLSTHGCDSTYPHGPIIPGTLVSAAKEIVRKKIMNNDFNAGQSLAELPETARFVAQTLGSAGRLFRAIKRRDAYRAKEVIKDYFEGSGRNWKKEKIPSKIPKSPASAYLQYQFAWKPMMNDIYNTVELATQGLAKPASFKAAVNLDDKSFGKPTYFYDHKYDIEVNGKFKRGVEVGQSFSVRDQTMYDLSRLGLTNPLAIAWELVPLSFVFDWFLPLGSFFESLTTGIGLKFETGYVTRYLDNDFTVIYADKGYVGGDKSRLQIKVTSMNRQVLDSFPPTWPYPKVDLSLGQIVTGLALIASSR